MGTPGRRSALPFVLVLYTRVWKAYSVWIYLAISQTRRGICRYFRCAAIPTPCFLPPLLRCNIALTGPRAPGAAISHDLLLFSSGGPLPSP